MEKGKEINNVGYIRHYIVIKNDRSLHWNYLIKNVYYRKDDFKVLHYPNCIRLEKLKKLNYV